jgi:large-conductance mechanosensitive channel
MKNNFDMILVFISPLLLILGDLGLFFSQTMFLGYVLFAFGCVLGLVNLARNSRFELTERFHLITIIAALLILGTFIFTGVLNQLIIAAIVLFVIDFIIHVIDAREISDEKPVKEYKKHNEEELYHELEEIQDEFNHVKILEEGDIEDVSLRRQAEQIKSELKAATVLQDPKGGRYLYTENGKMFHLAGCMSMQRTKKKEIKTTNSRTELLAKGYKACKVCNS